MSGHKPLLALAGPLGALALAADSHAATASAASASVTG